MANDVKVKILDNGLPALIGSYVDLINFQPEYFLIGDAAGFTPLTTETTYRGNLSFAGSRGDVKFKTVDNNQSLKILLTIPETANNIVIGNIVLYSYYEGLVRPVAMVVFNEPILKRNPTTEITDNFYKYPGNRMVINVSISYVDIDKYDTDYSFTVLTPNFANIPYIGNDGQIPQPAENPHSQFVVNDMTTLGYIPTFVTKDQSNNSYFASPLFQNLASPKFGILNGFDADTYEGNRVRWVWGQLYKTPITSYQAVVGNVSYTSDTTDAIVIGGLSY